MKNKLVSIITPTFNRADVLERCIKSILNQTYKKFKLIIIDDASSDNIQKEVMKYKNKDKRIHYIKNKKNIGPSASRNKGIKIAKGEFIAFLDSDDSWDKNHLKRNIEFFSKQDIDLIFSDVSSFKENGELTLKSLFKTKGIPQDKHYGLIDSKKRWYNIQNTREWLIEFLTKQALIYPSTVVYKNIGKLFNEKYRLHEDVIFFSDMIINNAKFGLIDKVGCKRFESHDNLSVCYTQKQRIRFNKKRLDMKCLIYKKYKNKMTKREKRHLKEFIIKKYSELIYGIRKVNKLKALYFYLKSLKYKLK